MSPWRRAFHVLPRFDAEYSALTFPVRALDRAIPDADRSRWEQAWHEAERAGPGDLVQQVARALRMLLLRGEFGGDEVAGLLAIHRRTLNRRLQAQGTTFREVLDDVRSSVARELLADSDISLDDIAASLGYAAVSPFMRAFRRWSGDTPGQWRRRARERLTRSCAQAVRRSSSRARPSSGPAARPARAPTRQPAYASPIVSAQDPPVLAFLDTPTLMGVACGPGGPRRAVENCEDRGTVAASMWPTS